MSDTEAALQEALADHILSGSGDRSDAEAAALAHLAEVDPGYAGRTAALPADARIVAPNLKAAYDAALEASQADPGDAKAAAKAADLATRYSAARQAARVADGRPITTTI